VDRVLRQTIDRKVFSEHAEREVATWQFGLPTVVVRNWVAIHGLVRPAVNTEVSRAIAMEIELAQGNTA